MFNNNSGFPGFCRRVAWESAKGDLGIFKRGVVGGQWSTQN